MTCERGLAASIAEARARRWREDNCAALDAYDRFLEAHGLPLEKLRLF